MTQKSHNTEIRGYKIIGIIAKTNMSIIYKAIKSDSNKDVILKKLIVNAPKNFAERIKREASIMKEIIHPNVVNIIDFFIENNQTFIVMEYINGCNLSELIKKLKKIPFYIACYILLEIAKGLEYAHKKGIIHRDLKPSNILISIKGEVKITDFGIALKFDRNEQNEITKTGTFLGTPAYMSPEQINSSKNVDFKTDIYSLGIIFYEMLTGIPPYSNELSFENLMNIKKGIYPKIKFYNKSIPYDLEKFVKYFIYHKKEKRINNLKKVINKLEFYLLKQNKISIKNIIKKVILDQYNVKELNFFEYKFNLLFIFNFKNIVKFLIYFLIFILFIYFYNNFLILLFFPDKYSVLILNIENNKNNSIIKFISGKNNNTIKTIKINENQKKIKHKFILQKGIYYYYVMYNNIIEIKNINLDKNLNENIIIRPINNKLVNINFFVYNENYQEIKDYEVYYKKSINDNWIKYDKTKRIYNNNQYDFLLYKKNYKEKLIKNINITSDKDEIVFYIIF